MSFPCVQPEAAASGDVAFAAAWRMLRRREGPFRNIGAYMIYSQYFLHNLMDMGSLLGTILGTVQNYKKDLDVHC